MLIQISQQRQTVFFHKADEEIAAAGAGFIAVLLAAFELIRKCKGNIIAKRAEERRKQINENIVTVNV